MLQTTCQETISILRALLFGADDACVSVDPLSILMALVPFVLGVVVLQWIARRLWAKVTGKGRQIEEMPDKTGPCDVQYDGGPIKSRKSGW